MVFQREKNGFLINSGHKTAAAIVKIGESDDGVFLSFFLS